MYVQVNDVALCRIYQRKQENDQEEKRILLDKSSSTGGCIPINNTNQSASPAPKRKFDEIGVEYNSPNNGTQEDESGIDLRLHLGIPTHPKKI